MKLNTITLDFLANVPHTTVLNFIMLLSQFPSDFPTHRLVPDAQCLGGTMERVHLSFQLVSKRIVVAVDRTNKSVSLVHVYLVILVT